jgi:hypothetical protein
MPLFSAREWTDPHMLRSIVTARPSSPVDPPLGRPNKKHLTIGRGISAACLPGKRSRSIWRREVRHYRLACENFAGFFVSAAVGIEHMRGRLGERSSLDGRQDAESPKDMSARLLITNVQMVR